MGNCSGVNLQDIRYFSLASGLFVWVSWHINLCWLFKGKSIFIVWKGNTLAPNTHIYPTPLLGQDMTQGHFLSGVEQVSIQSFPSPRLVASPRLENTVCPTIYPWLEGE